MISNRYFSIFLILLLGSCSNDSFFADQYKPTFLANPSFSNGLEDSWKAVMLSKESAIVYTGQYSLSLENDFKDIKYFQYSGNSSFETVIFYDGYHVYFADGTYKDPQTNQKPFDLTSVYAKLPPFKFITNRVFENSSTFYFALQTSSLSGETIDLYKANLETAAVTKVSNIFASTNYFVLKSCYATESSVIVIGYYSDFITPGYYAFTTQDGLTWTQSLLPSNETEMLIKEASGKNSTNILKTSSGYFVSPNQGQSWSKINFGAGRISSSVQVIDSNTIYAVIEEGKDENIAVISRLLKSTDKGVTWALNSAPFYGDKISFFDSANGIAYGDLTLQVTHDGGTTWKPILMP